MPIDTTIKVERDVREQITSAARARSMTANQFLTGLMVDYRRRLRMAEAAASMRGASDEVTAAYRAEFDAWSATDADGLDDG